MGNKQSATRSGSRSSSQVQHAASSNDVSKPPYEARWKGSDQYLNKYDSMPDMSHNWPMERETPDGGTPNNGSPSLKRISFQQDPAAMKSNESGSRRSSKDQTEQERKGSKISKKGSTSKVIKSIKIMVYLKMNHANFDTNIIA